MNRISSDVTASDAKNVNKEIRRQFLITLAIIVFIGVICLFAFHGTYFWSKSKLSKRNNQQNFKNLNQFTEKSGTVQLIIFDFVSTLPLNRTSLQIFVIDSNNSMQMIPKELYGNQLLKFATDRDISSNQIIVIKINNKIFASIPINQIIITRSEATVIIDSGETSFKLKFVWIS